LRLPDKKGGGLDQGGREKKKADETKSRRINLWPSTRGGWGNEVSQPSGALKRKARKMPSKKHLRIEKKTKGKLLLCQFTKKPIGRKGRGGDKEKGEQKKNRQRLQVFLLDRSDRQSPL